MEEHAGSRDEGGCRRTLTFTHLSEPIMGDPRRVAKPIAGALSTRWRRSRYLVGHDARALAVWSR